MKGHLQNLFILAAIAAWFLDVWGVIWGGWTGELRVYAWVYIVVMAAWLAFRQWFKNR